MYAQCLHPCSGFILSKDVNDKCIHDTHILLYFKLQVQMFEIAKRKAAPCNCMEKHLHRQLQPKYLSKNMNPIKVEVNYSQNLSRCNAM